MRDSRAKRLNVQACALFLAVLTRGTLAWAALAVLGPSGIAQLQFDELRKQYLPRDREVTRAVALGDVDGYGDLDLVAGNSGQNSGQQNCLYLNDISPTTRG